MLNQIAATTAPTKQWKNISHSANQTVDDHLQQAANQISGNAIDGDDSNITEKAKNIGKKPYWRCKKLVETINKKWTISKININLSLLKEIVLKYLSVFKRIMLMV